MCMVTTFSGRQGARDARGRALRPVLRAGSGPPDQRVAALHDPAARGLHREAEERLRLAERAIRVARVRAARAAAERSHVDRDQAARAARDVRRVRRAVPRRSLGRVCGPGLVRASSAARRLVRRRVDPGLAERAQRTLETTPPTTSSLPPTGAPHPLLLSSVRQQHPASRITPRLSNATPRPVCPHRAAMRDPRAEKSPYGAIMRPYCTRRCVSRARERRGTRREYGADALSECG